LRPIEQGFPVTPEDPPPYRPGMLSLMLDTSGRLEGLMAVPVDHDDGTAPATEPDWSRVLAETGLDPSKLQAVTPEWAPPVVVDRARPGRGRTTGSLMPGAHRGRLVPRAAGVAANDPSLDPARRLDVRRDQRARARRLALRHDAGRGDPRGRRLPGPEESAVGPGRPEGRPEARYGGVRAGAATILLQRHYVFAASEIGDVIAVLGFPLLLGAIVGLFYLALEPHLRRYWPAMLISWMRLLDGRFRDPLVGRDVAIGVLAGVAIRLCVAGYQLVTEALGALAIPGDTFAGPPLNQILVALSGTRQAIGNLTGICTVALLVSLGLLVLLLLCRLIGRRTWVGIVLFMLVTALPGLPPGVGLAPFLIQSVVFGGIFIAFLFRYGLVAG
jgi:serine/threonine-protein kinase